MVLSPKLYTFLCGCFAALGSILFGYDLGVIAGVLPAKDFLRVTGDPNEDYKGFIVSALLLGAFCGCLPACLIADRFSRRHAIFVGAIIFIFGGAIQTAAINREMILAGRFFAGFAIGMLSMLAPLYQSEIAHPSIRGSLTTLQQFFLGIGAFIASFVVYGLEVHHRDTAFQWRFALGLQIVPCLPLAALIFLFPESPRWLMRVGREEDAIQSLARLHARGDVTDLFVLAEAAELKAAVELERKLETGWTQLVANRSYFRRVALGVILQFSVQMTGVSVIQYYAPAIFAAIGFGTEKTLLFQSINSVIALIGEACCVLFVDKLGRRWPLILANVGSGVTFAVGTAIQAKYPAAANNTSASYAFVMMTWIFNFFFSAGIGPLSWAYPVEIMNTSIRAKGTAVSSMACWVSNFMIGQVTPKAFAAIGWKYYVVFAICGFTNGLTIWLLFPETKGRTLEEMDDFFDRTHWIVPLSKHEVVSKDEREEELRRGMVKNGTLAVPTLERFDRTAGSEKGMEDEKASL